MKLDPVPKTKKINQNAIVTAASIESLKKDEFIASLKDCLGLKNLAIERTGIDADTFYSWRKDEEFCQRVHEAQEYAGDQVEGMLFKKIQQGDTTAIMFYCETKLKSRGYYKKS